MAAAPPEIVSAQKFLAALNRRAAIMRRIAQVFQAPWRCSPEISRPGGSTSALTPGAGQRSGARGRRLLLRHPRRCVVAPEPVFPQEQQDGGGDEDGGRCADDDAEQ